MTRPTSTTLRREQIADAFIEELAQSGYDGATIARIGARAGLAPGLVHYHFASKEEILIVAVDRLDARLLARMPDESGAAMQRLEDLVDALLGAQPPDVVAVRAWVMVGAESLRKPEVARIYDAATARLRERMTRLVRDALAAAGRDASEVDELVTVLLCAVHGAWQLGMSTGQIPAGTASTAVRNVLRR